MSSGNLFSPQRTPEGPDECDCLRQSLHHRRRFLGNRGASPRRNVHMYRRVHLFRPLDHWTIGLRPINRRAFLLAPN